MASDVTARTSVRKQCVLGTDPSVQSLEESQSFCEYVLFLYQEEGITLHFVLQLFVPVAPVLEHRLSRRRHCLWWCQHRTSRGGPCRDVCPDGRGKGRWPSVRSKAPWLHSCGWWRGCGSLHRCSVGFEMPVGWKQDAIVHENVFQSWILLRIIPLLQTFQQHQLFLAENQWT